ncbi:MAG TPA: hypothetical protein PLX69_12645 [Leptospiraceae bacterium]|jgi:hypothetical protein|nr:hypothetical protein [Leptospiraceae bacterium]MBK7054700.1 hypothetical protein [Leptospiraceae bacterium]MBK9499230.1 hypothetical protein [Leptospiraceae bacterium]HRG47671.1 hypothetical protein [Leptospiraceae bacterium]HRG75400.1 hypothetical protein [Leptospiraceae bacterium]
MSLEFQNYLVYSIVLIALVKFTQPIWTFFYKLLFNKKKIQSEDTSCYTGTCAKCKVKT